MMDITRFALEDARRKGHDMQADTRLSFSGPPYWACRDCGRTVQESGGVIYGDAQNERCDGPVAP